MRTVCEAVRGLRGLLGMSQEQLARELGCATRTVARYESTRAPRGQQLAKLLRLCEKKRVCGGVWFDVLVESFNAEMGIQDSGVVPFSESLYALRTQEVEGWRG